MTAGCGCQRVGSPCCPHCRGKAENSHVAPLAAAREQVPGQVCTAGGSLRRQAPRPPPLPGAHATVFTSLSKHGQVMHSPSLLPPTVTTDLLSSCSLPRGPRWLPQHEASHLYTAVSNRKRWGGGAEGDVSQKLPGRFLLKRRCAGPDHVPPWHRGLGKQTCGSDDQHGHRPLRRGQVRWPQTKSGFT